MHLRTTLWFVVAGSLWPQGAAAQMSAPPITSDLPGVSRISAANAAGVLKYCEKQSLVSGVATDQVLGQFAPKPDMKSADYVAGSNGDIRGDGGKTFSMAKAPGYLQSRACDMVLQQAKSFAPKP